MVRVSAVRKPRQVRAAVHRVDVVGEAEDLLRVAVVVLQRDFHRQHAAVRQFALAFEVDRLVVQHALAAVQVLDEFADAARVEELVRLHRLHALVGQRDLQALVQERQLAQPLRQRVVVELRRLHDRRVGLEGDLRAGLRARLARPASAAPCGMPRSYSCSQVDPVAPDLQLQRLGQRVDAAHAHAVQPARNFVAVRIELAAGVQLGHHDFRRRHAFFLCMSTGMPRPLSIDGDRVVDVDGDVDLVAVARPALRPPSCPPLRRPGGADPPRRSSRCTSRGAGAPPPGLPAP